MRVKFSTEVGMSETVCLQMITLPLHAAPGSTKTPHIHRQGDIFVEWERSLESSIKSTHLLLLST